VPLTVPSVPTTDVITPVALSALPKGSNLFVAATDTTAGVGYLFGFAIGALTNCTNNKVVPTLTPLTGSPWMTGKQLSAVTQDPTGSFVFATDTAGNGVYAYAIGSGGLTAIGGSPFSTGNKPSAIVVDATGKYAYVANSLDSTVEAYSISGGALSEIATYPTDTQPVAIGIDTALNQYLYTANFLANTVSGFELSSSAGTLFLSQGTPFTSNANPTAIVTVTHGAVAKQ